MQTTKTQPTFRWDDEQREHTESRAYIAHLLRCYRNDAKLPLHKQRYNFNRLTRNVYAVGNSYPHSPIGIIRTA